MNAASCTSAPSFMPLWRVRGTACPFLYHLGYIYIIDGALIKILICYIPSIRKLESTSSHGDKEAT